MNVYLDNHSATRPCQSSLERMKPYLEEEWGASFSLHRLGSQQILALDGRIQMLYDLIGADIEDQFVFTSNGAEAIWQVYWSVFLDIARKEGKCHFITSCLEDAPTLLGLKRLEELGCFIKIAPCNNKGSIDVVKLKELMNPRTALLSIGLAQGLTGVLQPLEEIAQHCREQDVLLHIDATYAVGKIPLEFTADYITFSGDRMHSVKSSGALFAKKGRPVSQLLPSAIDVPSLIAFSAAAQQSMLTFELMGLEVARLRDLFERGILERLPETQVLFSDVMRLPNVSVIAFPHVHQEALLYAFNRKHLYASIGGAVHQQLSKLLLVAGYDERTAMSAVSFSLSRTTTQQEIEEAINRIVEAVLSLRAFSEHLYQTS